MKFRPLVKNTRDIKKYSYEIYKKMYDLERRKKISNIYSRRFDSDGEYYILLCIKNLNEFITYSLEDINDNEIEKIKMKYYKNLELFYNHTLNCCNNNNVIKSTYLKNVLISHTNLFNNILDKGLDARLNQEYWTDVYLTLVSIWGNKL